MTYECKNSSLSSELYCLANQFRKENADVVGDKPVKNDAGEMSMSDDSADNLITIAESLEECVRRLLTWKEAMEEKGLRVNAGKTKIMICGTRLDLLQSSGEFPCAVCRSGVGSNSIFCKGCKHWVHKKCSGLKLLTEDPYYRCTRCKGTACPLDGRSQREV